MIEESDLDRTFLQASSYLAEPFGWTAEGIYRLKTPLIPGKFGNRDTQIQEIAFRSLIVLGYTLGTYLTYQAPLPSITLILTTGALSKLFRKAGFACQPQGFCHCRGNLPAQPLLDTFSILTWNLCGVGGGLSLSHGGVPHFRFRADSIVQKLKEHDADVLVLQEIYDTAFRETLIEELKDHYAHAFFHMGANTLGSESGLMVFTKQEVASFSSTDFTNNPFFITKGFASLTLQGTPEDPTPRLQIIGTHLDHRDEDKRKEQFKQIQTSRQINLPTFLVGDLNIERDSQEERNLLAPFLDHGIPQGEITCSNQHILEWSQSEEGLEEERIDYISLFKEPTNSWRIFSTWAEKIPDEDPLSDHASIKITWTQS